MTETRNPFVLGKPIKDRRDFYGRRDELRELFESIVRMQPVAIIGEHRCGNTSILYQLMNPEVQREYLAEPDREALLFAFVNAQLSADGPESFYRRIGRALRRSEPDLAATADETVDPGWIEDCLDRIAGDGRRVVLLMDEFEVLAGFQASFWEWFRGLITEYDVSIVVASRVELGQYRAEWGTGSPFFNMFRSLFVGSFTRAEVEEFLAGTSAVAGIDWSPVRAAIEALGGRFPYFLQVAGSLFYTLAMRQPLSGSVEELEAVSREFSGMVAAHLEHTWTRLPETEREALSWLAVAAEPEDRERIGFRQALLRLERRGYVVDGRIFSTAFRDFILQQSRRVEVFPDTGEVRVEKRLIELPRKEFALLCFLVENEGEIVTKDQIAAAVWPEYDADRVGVTDAMIQKTISRLRREIDVPDATFQHIESVRGQGYRFQNASVYEVYRARTSPASPWQPLGPRAKPMGADGDAADAVDEHPADA